MSDVKLVRVDRNGTKYYESHKCSKCGGTGYIEYFNYVEGGRCFQCGGTGRHKETWKEYTPEYAAKLEERRIARMTKKTPEKNAKLFELWKLSEDGSAYVVLGETYERKDALKELGAHYHSLLGWYFDHPVEGVETHKMGIAEFSDGQDMYGVWIMPEFYTQGAYKLHPAVRKVQDAYLAKDNLSEWVGNVGDKLSVDVTVDHRAGFSTDWGWTNIFTFVDGSGNQFIWKTGSASYLGEGQTLTLTGKIKSHDEYRGVKQTVLTRCKVSNWSGEGEEE